jgi:DNA-binding NarL/FixJ family response regulator
LIFLLRSLRILIVDDFEPWVHLLQSIFKTEPLFHVVSTASDGCLALQSAEELKPDLVLLDVDLPLINGITLARSFQNFRPKPILLFVSQHLDPATIRAAIEAGGSGYVVKTDAHRELMQAIAMVCEGGRFFSTTALASIAERGGSA